MPQPVSFQMTCEVSRALKSSGSPMMFHVPMSWARRKTLMSPPLPSICWKSATTTTHDRKCGR